MNYRSLLGTAGLVGAALLMTFAISNVLDVWLHRSRSVVAGADGYVEKSPLAAATSPVANPVMRSRIK